MELSVVQLLIKCGFFPANMCSFLQNKLYSIRCRIQNGKALFRIKFFDCWRCWNMRELLSLLRRSRKRALRCRLHKNLYTTRDQRSNGTGSLTLNMLPTLNAEKANLRWFLRNKIYRWIFLRLSLNVLYQALFRKIQ